MKKLLALLLALLLCAAFILPAALAEEDALVSEAESAEDSDSESDDAIDEWLYEEDDTDEEELLTDADLASDEDTADEPMSELAETEQDDLLGAMEVYSWFAMEPLDVDENMPSDSGDMWRVLDERYATADGMLEILNSYFSQEIVDELWDSNINPYKQINGYLYTNGEGRSMDERLDEVQIDVTEQTDDKIVLVAAVSYTEPDEYGTQSEEFTYERNLIDGQWKYTLFPFFW